MKEISPDELYGLYEDTLYQCGSHIFNYPGFIFGNRRQWRIYVGLFEAIGKMETSDFACGRSCSNVLTNP